MSPCHNLEPSLVARDSSRLLSVKPNEWMHLSPFYTCMHGEWLRYAKSTSQFHWRFLLVRDVQGFQVNPLCRHDITSPFPPSGNGGYVRNLDDFLHMSKARRHCRVTLIMRSGFLLRENPLVLSHHCRGLMYSRPKGITLDAADIRPSSF